VPLTVLVCELVDAADGEDAATPTLVVTETA
jgi:hypothetical protein